MTNKEVDAWLDDRAAYSFKGFAIELVQLDHNDIAQVLAALAQRNVRIGHDRAVAIAKDRVAQFLFPTVEE